MPLIGGRLLLMGQRRSSGLVPTPATIGLIAPDPIIQTDNVLAAPSSATVALTAPDPTLGLPTVLIPPRSLVALTAPNPAVYLSTLAPPVSLLVLTAPNPTITVSEPTVTWPNGYVAYRDIVIPAQAAALTNLTMVLSEIEQELRHDDFGGRLQSETGNDLLLTTPADAVIPYFIATYVTDTGRVVSLVNVANLSTSARTSLRLYYGKAGAPSGQDPDGVFAGTHVAWTGVTGADLSGGGRHLAPPVGGPPSGFVSVAPIVSFGGGRTIYRRGTSDLNFNNENVFIPGQDGMPNGTNVTIDLRDRVFTNHEYPDGNGSVHPGQLSPVRPKQLKEGTSIVGAEIVGAQPDLTQWDLMKTDNPRAMDDNGILYDNMNVNSPSITYIENCVFRKQFDGINTNTLSRSTRYIVNGCYGEKLRDEFVENDGQCELEINDTFVTACHNFVSMRAGKRGTNYFVDIDSPVNKRLKLRNCIARCRGQYYDTDAGGSPTGPREKRTQPWPNGSEITSSSSALGYSHRETFKGAGAETERCTIFLDAQDCVFAFESQPTAGPFVMPPGVFVNVVLCYFGPAPTPLLVTRPGVTLMTGNDAWEFYRSVCLEWLTAHGCTNISSLDADFNGADFPFLHL